MIYTGYYTATQANKRQTGNMNVEASNAKEASRIIKGNMRSLGWTYVRVLEVAQTYNVDKWQYYTARYNMLNI